MRPREIAIKSRRHARRSQSVQTVSPGLCLEDWQVQPQRIGIGHFIGSAAADRENAVAAPAVGVAEGQTVDLVFGDRGGERAAFLFASAHEALQEPQATVGSRLYRGEACSESDVAVSDLKAARLREEGAAVRELVFGIAEHEV